MALLAVVFGTFCLVVGWHWKLMHRSWQDVRRYRNQAKGRIPSLQAARSHHTSRALVFAVILAVILLAVIH